MRVSTRLSQFGKRFSVGLALAAVVLLPGDGDVDSGLSLVHVKSGRVEHSRGACKCRQCHSRTLPEVEDEICHPENDHRSREKLLRKDLDTNKHPSPLPGEAFAQS